MFGSISHKPGIYCNVGGSCDRGGIFMDYKKEIIELLDKVKLESILKRVYKLLVYLYLREK